jgi:hypothetical protein
MSTETKSKHTPEPCQKCNGLGIILQPGMPENLHCRQCDGTGRISTGLTGLIARVKTLETERDDLLSERNDLLAEKESWWKQDRALKAAIGDNLSMRAKASTEEGPADALADVRDLLQELSAGRLGYDDARRLAKASLRALGA